MVFIYLKLYPYPMDFSKSKNANISVGLFFLIFCSTQETSVDLCVITEACPAYRQKDFCLAHFWWSLNEEGRTGEDGKNIFSVPALINPVNVSEVSGAVGHKGHMPLMKFEIVYFYPYIYWKKAFGAGAKISLSLAEFFSW